MIPADSAASPAVWRWYMVYCIAMALLYILVVGAGVTLLVIDPALLGEEAIFVRTQGVIFAGLGLLLAIPFGIAPFLPRKSWVWIYGLVMIGIGMTSMCCMPATIPLLIFWIKPEAQRFFGRDVTSDGQS